MQTLEKFGPKAYKLIKIQLITEIIIPSSEPVQYIVPDIVIKYNQHFSFLFKSEDTNLITLHILFNFI